MNRELFIRILNDIDRVYIYTLIHDIVQQFLWEGSQVFTNSKLFCGCCWSLLFYSLDYELRPFIKRVFVSFLWPVYLEGFPGKAYNILLAGCFPGKPLSKRVISVYPHLSFQFCATANRKRR